MILGPEKKYIYVIGGNHTNLPNPEKSLVPRTWKEDLLLPRLWDARGHARGKLAPGGGIARTDPEGKIGELVSNVYRNQYDFAFNKNGELFTYDADMEW
ncbi:MAG: heme-binding protein, partial [Planctomycetota bacterium]|nr:heme-binding protein [Planctomycetota bacterium]